MTRHKRIYVLDTNVLMHDPTALFRFMEHDIFLPMVVLEELDAAKKGMSEVSRNTRQVSRFMNELISQTGQDSIHDGVTLNLPGWGEQGTSSVTGKLYFETNREEASARDQMPDNEIINASLKLRVDFPGIEVVLVSKDINLRIKASVLGLQAEDYHNDQVLDDLALLYSGSEPIDDDFWNNSDALKSWTEGSETHYEVQHERVEQWHPNQFLYQPVDNGTEVIVTGIDQGTATLRVTHDYRRDHSSVWGIKARNREQNFALNLLMDDDIDFVTLLGTAGTGKTLLSLAAGLVLTLEEKRYSEIIMTRATVPVGEDIGFLPGTEEEKMTPWMGALTDNLEVLTGNSDADSWGKAATNDLLSSRIKIRSMNFMRGRTFLNRYVIIDEAQNLTPKQMKTLLTRAGPGTKIICLGDVEQIDTPYLTETSSGLTYAVDRFKQWQHSGHVTLKRGERSRLADFASRFL